MVRSKGFGLVAASKPNGRTSFDGLHPSIYPEGIIWAEQFAPALRWPCGHQKDTHRWLELYLGVSCSGSHPPEKIVSFIFAFLYNYSERGTIEKAPIKRTCHILWSWFKCYLLVEFLFGVMLPRDPSSGPLFHLCQLVPGR